MKKALVKTTIKTPLEQSADDYALATVKQSLKRADDIMRDKKRAVITFFSLIKKEADEITTDDVRQWYQTMLKKKLSENYIYTCLSHLLNYFEWLRTMPEFAPFIKVNPVRAIVPKAPKKYNSPKIKSLTDEELSKLWLYLENLAQDDGNLVAVRDYAIFRLFMATGMRREEIIGVGASDIKLENGVILIHTKVKGGNYEWRTIEDEEVRAALERYLRLAKRKSVIGHKDRALWIRFDRAAKEGNAKKIAEKPQDGEPRLTSHAFDKNIRQYAAEAGIGEFNIHKFRHTFARIVSEDSGSIVETQDALGHKDIQTTQIYVSRISFKKDKYSRGIRRRIKPVEVEKNEE